MNYLKSGLACILVSSMWAAFALVASFYGWWMSPVVETGDAAGFSQFTREQLARKNQGNSAFLVIENGEVFDSGYFSAAGANPVDAETMFSLASMSKWVTAIGVMLLVEQGKLDLDKPVNHYLTRWKLPDHEFSNPVLVRHLLSHTSGLEDGLGFGDYDLDEALPTLEESLAEPRASGSQGVRFVISVEPGTEFNYSGGGYLILQLLIEEVSGIGFVDFIQQQIFDPLNMQRSTFVYSQNDSNTSPSFDVNGEVAISYKYAVAAATGLKASASDLGRLSLAMMPANRSHLTRVSENMRVPAGLMFGLPLWGLGEILYAETDLGDFVYGHDGANEPAINTALRINPDTNDAIIVLVTGHKRLATYIGYEWVLWQTGYPDVLSTNLVISSSVRPMLIGLFLIVASFLFHGWFTRPTMNHLGTRVI